MLAGWLAGWLLSGWLAGWLLAPWLAGLLARLGGFEGEDFDPDHFLSFPNTGADVTYYTYLRTCLLAHLLHMSYRLGGGLGGGN